MISSAGSVWVSKMYWIDTHSHLPDPSFREDPKGYLDRCLENDVKRILAIALNKEELEYLLSLESHEVKVDIAFGYHPEDLLHITDSDWEYLERALANPRIIAVGEIGLDYHWDTSYNELQKEKFIYQISLANMYRKPILVHARDASEDTFNILKEHPCLKGCILHCYSGSYEMAKRFMTLDNIYFAFGGTLTYKNAKQNVECASKLPLDRLFVESDSPYLTPVPFRGKVNESKNVIYAGEKMAELREDSIEHLQEVMSDNYARLFGVKL